MHNGTTLWRQTHLTTLHGVGQAVQLPVCHRHVVLAHGAVLQAPAFAVVVDQFSGFTGEEQRFLVVLWGTHRGWGVVRRETTGDTVCTV